jgi:hypothetical protein
MFGPKIVSYGFDRAKKTAQDVHKKISKNYAHSTFTWPKRKLMVPKNVTFFNCIFKMHSTK